MIWPLEFAAGNLDDGEVSLRPYVFDDAEGMFAAVRDASVWEHLPRRIPETAGELDAGFQAGAAGGLRLVFTVRQAGVIVGTTSVHHDPEAPGGVEIGSTLFDRAVWGTGVNGRAKQLLISAVFAAGAEWIRFRTDERNLRSAAAIRKLGAVDLGVRQDTLVRRDGSVRRSRFFQLDRPELTRNLSSQSR